MRSFIEYIGPHAWGWCAVLQLSITLCLVLLGGEHLNAILGLLIGMYCMMLWGKDRELANERKFSAVMVNLLANIAKTPGQPKAKSDA